MTPTVTVRGCLEITQYDRGREFYRLLWCPICGPEHEFEDHEPRWRHFLDEHQPEDLGLMPIGLRRDTREAVTDGGCDVPETCPECGGGPFYRNTSTAFWCENCERELWQDGDTWYSCDATGDAELVTDGGHDRVRNPLTKILDDQSNPDYARADLDIALERLENMGDDYDRVRYHVREALQCLIVAEEGQR